MLAADERGDRQPAPTDDGEGQQRLRPPGGVGDDGDAGVGALGEVALEGVLPGKALIAADGGLRLQRQPVVADGGDIIDDADGEGGCVRTALRAEGRGPSAIVSATAFMGWPRCDVRRLSKKSQEFVRTRHFKALRIWLRLFPRLLEARRSSFNLTGQDSRYSRSVGKPLRPLPIAPGRACRCSAAAPLFTSPARHALFPGTTETRPDLNRPPNAIVRKCHVDPSDPPNGARRRRRPRRPFGSRPLPGAPSPDGCDGGGTGGVYFVYGGGLARVLTEKLPNTQATSQVTGGSVDNINLVTSGDADIGFSTFDW